MRKHIAVLSIVFLILTSLIFYGSAQFLFQKTKQDIQNAAINRIISAIQNATPSIERIINDSPDIKKDMLLIIALTEYIHDLAFKVENINSIFILDGDKNLLATSNTADSLSFEKRAGLYDNAIMRNSDMTQPVDLEVDSEAAAQESAEGESQNKARPVNNNNAIFLYSTPINDNYTLFCEILLQEGINKARYWRNWYYFPGAAVIAIVLTVLLFFLSKLILGIPYNKLKRALEKNKRRQEEERVLMQDEMQRWQEQESRKLQEELLYHRQKAEQEAQSQEIMPQIIEPEIETPIEQKPQIEDSAEIISEDKYKEMANLFVKENEKKAKTISDLEKDRNALRDFFRHFLSDFAKQNQIYAVIDASNKVIFAKDETGTIFKSARIAPGTKFNDMILIPEMSQYISQPSSQPNKELSVVINDEFDISFKAVYVKGYFIGTIISNV